MKADENLRSRCSPTKQVQPTNRIHEYEHRILLPPFKPPPQQRQQNRNRNDGNSCRQRGRPPRVPLDIRGKRPIPRRETQCRERHADEQDRQRAGKRNIQMYDFVGAGENDRNTTPDNMKCTPAVAARVPADLAFKCCVAASSSAEPPREGKEDGLRDRKAAGELGPM